MDLNQAEVAVTTQHHDRARGQEKDNWLQIPDFNFDLGKPCAPRFELFAEEETPNRYMEWTYRTHSSTWNGCASTFFRYGKRWNSWKNPTRIVSRPVDRYEQDRSTEDAHLLWWRITSNFSRTRPTVMSHARWRDDQPAGALPRHIKQITFDTGIPTSRYSMTITIKTYRMEISFKGPVMPVDPYSQMAFIGDPEHSLTAKGTSWM